MSDPNDDKLQPPTRRIIADNVSPVVPGMVPDIAPDEPTQELARRAPWQFRHAARLAQSAPPVDLYADAPVTLRVEQLSVRLGGITVLRELNIDVRKGETIAIIGESGCGKTVLLKTIIGLIPATKGRVVFDGNDMGTLDEQELTHQRTRFGFVFQQAALFDSMTILENVGFPLRQHTCKTEEEVNDIACRLLEEVGLSPRAVAHKMPVELSGGMRKRVGFARALAMGPEIMLYDEPTTGLDPIMSDVINELMLSVKRQHNVTGIIVTHDMLSAKKCADRILMLYPISRLNATEGQIIYNGNANSIDFCDDPRVTQFVRGEAGERVYDDSQHLTDTGTYKPAYPVGME